MILWQHQRDLSMSDKWEGPESRGMEEEEKEESIDQGEYQEESRDQGEYLFYVQVFSMYYRLYTVCIPSK